MKNIDTVEEWRERLINQLLDEIDKDIMDLYETDRDFKNAVGVMKEKESGRG